MKTVNMHEAKTNLSRLVAEAASGEAFIIARAGRPLVRRIRRRLVCVHHCARGQAPCEGRGDCT